MGSRFQNLFNLSIEVSFLFYSLPILIFGHLLGSLVKHLDLLPASLLYHLVHHPRWSHLELRVVILKVHIPRCVCIYLLKAMEAFL